MSKVTIDNFSIYPSNRIKPVQVAGKLEFYRYGGSGYFAKINISDDRMLDDEKPRKIIYHGATQLSAAVGALECLYGHRTIDFTVKTDEVELILEHDGQRYKGVGTFQNKARIVQTAVLAYLNALEKIVGKADVEFKG